ncbi:MAG: CRTAC1 family protein, partial [bacterium]|nr:CRTAC1 family protein [bacterium]
VVFTQGGKVTLLLNREGSPKVSTVAAAGAPLFADLENRGRDELIVGGRVFRNKANGEFAVGAIPAGGLEAGVWTVADFDSDGRSDLAAVSGDGAVHLLKNRTETKNRWMRVALDGKKAPKLSPVAEVEVKAGTRYQKKIYRGVPLLFGLRADATVDTIRITWPNGLIQNEMKQPANQSHRYEEEERLSGSCPMIWTWNGKQFEYITDVLGVAPLGASAGDGTYFPTDHDEYIQIPGEALVADGGRYEIRITEELSEIAYLDQIELIAVDHPADTDIFVNDKFQGPPFPEFRLFGARERLSRLGDRR